MLELLFMAEWKEKTTGGKSWFPREVGAEAVFPVSCNGQHSKQTGGSTLMDPLCLTEWDNLTQDFCVWERGTEWRIRSAGGGFGAGQRSAHGSSLATGGGGVKNPLKKSKRERPTPKEHQCTIIIAPIKEKLSWPLGLFTLPCKSQRQRKEWVTRSGKLM